MRTATARVCEQPGKLNKSAARSMAEISAVEQRMGGRPWLGHFDHRSKPLVREVLSDEDRYLGRPFTTITYRAGLETRLPSTAVGPIPGGRLDGDAGLSSDVVWRQ